MPTCHVRDSHASKFGDEATTKVERWRRLGDVRVKRNRTQWLTGTGRKRRERNLAVDDAQSRVTATVERE